MTTTGRWSEIDKLFREIRNLPVEERHAALHERCANPTTRVEVESLLEHDEPSGVFLQSPALGSGFHVGAVEMENPQRGAPIEPGDEVGQYAVTRIIASGGMAVVYEARQSDPPRTVAVKVMRHGISGSVTALRRFQDEARILARLSHEAIAQLYEFGLSESSDGAGALPFIAMEYVPGAKAITDAARESSWHVRQRLDMFIRVCMAVHHGHQRGIIHRDLKPSNILVDAEGRPKIIDFGIAHITDSDITAATVQTSVGELLGTLKYMSPEQCDADPHGLDVRSDIYSLGIVLYELLTGKLPYDVPANIYRATQIIKQTPPQRPSSHGLRIGRDLDTILLTALDKDRQKRYQSAAELAADLRRYLNRQPIQARPARLAYRFSMLLKRNPALAAVTALLVIATLVGSAAFVKAGLEAQHQRRKLDAVLETIQTMFDSPSTDRAGENVRVVDVLDDASHALDTTPAGDPEIEAEVRAMLGQTYETVGRYADAKREYERALELFRSTIGEKHPRVAELMMDVSGSYYDEADYQTAKALMDKALAIQLDLFGERHVGVARAYNDLALIFMELGQLPEAERQMRKAVELRRELLGNDHWLTAQSLFNLSATRALQEDPKGAIPFIEESTSILQRSRKRPIMLANQKQFYGRILIALGDLDKADEQVQGALLLLRSAVGDRHPSLANAILTLARLTLKRGDAAGAETLYRQVIDIAVEKYGPQHPYTVQVNDELTKLLESMGKSDEANSLKDD